jgi:Cd2+/Zn2+-exporting ATPase
MTHDLFARISVEKQTFRASALLIATMMGGILVFGSLLIQTFPQDWMGLDVAYHPKVLAFIGAILLGVPLVWNAAKELIKGHTHMDELVALAVLAAFAMQEYQTAGVIAFFLIIASLVERRTALGARASIESLISLAPRRATLILEDGTEQEVDAARLRPGQRVRVRPGDNIPADGEITHGESAVNQANITGESLPVDKAVGDEVFSGTTNLTGALDIVVRKAGEDTTLGRVQKLILQAEGTKIPLMRLIDRYAAWYTPTVLMIAAVVLFFTRDTSRAIAMLVVACPCALILATPTAIVAALSAAARLGILVKDPGNLEVARSLTAIMLDKTGTLTTGDLAVTRLNPAPGVDGAELLRAAANADQLSKHPVALAVLAVAKEARLKLERPREFKEVSGRGVIAKLNGDTVLVGRAAWLKEQGADTTALAQPEMAEPEGISTLYVARNGRVLGWIGLEDRTRPDARRAIDELRGLGVRQLTMVTGDRWSVARRVSQEMGCTDVFAEVLPAQKLELVDELRRAGHRVAVVGDGVNDAPALAAGDLSVAMGAAGSDVAINSASIALMNNNLSRLPFLVRLSRSTIRVIRQNLIFGVSFIVVAEVIAAMGNLPAVWAAVLHTAASTIVIFNSARLVRSGERLDETATPPTTRERPARQPARQLAEAVA